MNERCETCHAEKVCAYEYKPTECADMRKFKLHPDAVKCGTCRGTGYDYPLMCRACKGSGLMLRSNAQDQARPEAPKAL